ncbi:hypothetical protein SETIT_6G147600v2 [Setaria italica]|uniref:TFIIS N-terminal domain-containing protein n=1 Tax=Setaria italica TaxID=4555 RepID=A0A368RLJ8_SETIT|nr:hypothetical protein SETIT_6G147600v2 [Setaria italica]
MALRRLKPLLGAFEHIDAAIEAAAGAEGCRDEFRRARARIIEMICDAAAADDGAGGEKAEGLCALLDEAMAESVATLRAVPLEKTALASGGLIGAVDALMREHPSERVRGLAGDVVRGWRAGPKAEIARAMAKLDALPSTPPPPLHDDTAPAAGSDTKAKKTPEEQPRPRKSAVVSSSRRARTAESYAPLSKMRSDPIVSSSSRVSTAESYAPLLTKKSAPIVVANSSAKPSANMGAPTAVPAKPKKTPPVVVSTSSAKPSVSMGAPTFVPAQPKKTPLVIVSSTAEEKKLEATKRKLHERYQEAEDAKRRRTIQSKSSYGQGGRRHVLEVREVGRRRAAAEVREAGHRRDSSGLGRARSDRACWTRSYRVPQPVGTTPRELQAPPHTSLIAASAPSRSEPAPLARLITPPSAAAPPAPTGSSTRGGSRRKTTIRH